MSKPRLFVDCDDTLVLWADADGNVLGGPHPYGRDADEPVRNDALVAAIVARRHEFSEVVLWSGGGWRYAAGWMRYLTDAGVVPLIGMEKAPTVPLPGDLCIEDDNGTWHFANAVTWQEFVAQAEVQP